MARKCRAHTAAWLRIEANANLFKGHTTDAIRGDLPSHDVRLSIIERWEEHGPLATRLKHSANLSGVQRAQRECSDQRVSR